jgi:hypothetical protein
MVGASSSPNRKNKKFMGVIVASEWIPILNSAGSEAILLWAAPLANRAFIRGATIDPAERALDLT